MTNAILSVGPITTLQDQNQQFILIDLKIVIYLCRCEVKLQKQGKSSPASKRSSESSNKTLCASASHSASCVSADIIEDEDGVSRSASVTDSDKTLTP